VPPTMCHALDPETCDGQFTRKSVQGLSLALFVLAFLGNLFYVFSIFASPVLYSAPAARSPPPAVLSPSASLPPTLFAGDVPPKTRWSSPAGRAFLRESLPLWILRPKHKLGVSPTERHKSHLTRHYGGTSPKPPTLSVGCTYCVIWHSSAYF